MKTLLKKDLLLSKMPIVVIIVALLILGPTSIFVGQLDKGLGGSLFMTIILISLTLSLVEKDLKDGGYLLYEGLGVDRTSYIRARYIYLLLVYFVLSLLIVFFEKVFLASGSIWLAEEYKVKNTVFGHSLAYIMNSNYLYFQMQKLILYNDRKTKLKSGLLMLVNLIIGIFLVYFVTSIDYVSMSSLMIMLAGILISHLISYKASEILYKKADL